ncbi:Gp49 family protein [Psychrobacter sp. MES7-P7E]|uniref:Gp49 family protein n=1 Tax=Psychrobacter sp. MES7-P7E TaxID=2058322 RepID=UPI0018D594C1|nr:Gp49 family protein [Psychrobacter sp. MES7-P7E]
MTDLRNKVTKEQLDELVAQSKVEYAVFGKKLTVAVITLPTNFKVTGEASCVDASNFNKELGETYALENAVKKLWELEGYLLANDRYRAKQKKSEPCTNNCVAPCEYNYFVVGGSATQVGGINLADKFDFGLAIHALKSGKKVMRAGWNGKGMFLYYVPAASYPMQRNSLETMGGIFPDDMVPYGAYIAMKTAQDNVVPWLASQTDVLAEDWQLA